MHKQFKCEQVLIISWMEFKTPLVWITNHFLVIQKDVLTYNTQESKPKHNFHKSTKKCTNIKNKLKKHT
jgi:hypothetical protein